MKNKLSVFTGGAAAIAMITFVSAAGAQDWSLARFLDAWHGRGVARGRRDRHHKKYSGYRRIGGRSGTNKC